MLSELCERVHEDLTIVIKYSDTSCELRIIPRVYLLTMQPHSRFSISSLDQPASTTSTSSRFSLPAPSLAASLNTQFKSTSRPSIYERPLNKTRNAEVSLSAFSFLFSEIIQYTQNRVEGIEDLERRLVLLCFLPAQLAEF